MTIHEPLPDRVGRALLAADRLLRRIEFVTVVIAGLVIFFVMWIGVAEIFSRKLFNYPLYGQLDIIELTMSSYALLPISYCWRAAGHIRVEIAIDLLAGRRRWLLELVTTVLALVLVTAIRQLIERGAEVQSDGTLGPPSTRAVQLVPGRIKLEVKEAPWQ